MPYTTYRDLLDHLSMYAGKGVKAETVSACRSAAQQALREFPTHREWSYYNTVGRVNTVAMQTAGTIQYTDSTATVVLSGATWPAWAASGLLLYGTVIYSVQTVVNATTLILDPSTTIGADLPAGSGYTLFRDQYPLPADFSAISSLVVATTSVPVVYRDYGGIVAGRRLNQGPSQPYEVTVIGNGTRDGLMALKFWPPPDIVYPIDFAYRRRPAPAILDGITDGLASTTASSTAVAGKNTNFSARMVGSVIRIGYDPKTVPTGLSGVNPYQVERQIVSVQSPTALTVDGPIAQTISNCTNIVSDPIDLEPGAMQNALFKLAQRTLRSTLRMKPLPGEDAEVERALAAARDADTRYFGHEGAGRNNRYRRFADMPAVLNQAI